MSTNAGIDYGRGATNIDQETGIRYGVINGNALCGHCNDLIMEHGIDLEYKNLRDEMRKFINAKVRDIIDEFGLSEWANKPEELSQEIFELLSLDGVEMTGNEYLYEKDGYVIETNSHYNWVVIKSPYYTTCKFCSPCYPGAGDLNSPCDDGIKAYCLGPEWFDGDCPYEIHSIMHRVRFTNRQVIGQMCSWVEAPTKEEAIDKALREKEGLNPDYDPATNSVWFDGGVTL